MNSSLVEKIFGSRSQADIFCLFKPVPQARFTRASLLIEQSRKQGD
jgi:hypothetical protein